MKTYKDIIVLIAITVLLVIGVVFGLSHFMNIKPVLSAQEQAYSHFSYRKAEVPDRGPSVVSGLNSPIRIQPSSEKSFPPEPLAEVAPREGGPKDDAKERDKKKESGLTLIMVKDQEKLAILDGDIVRIGDRTKRGRIKMIKREGILVNDNEGDKWLKID